MKYINYKTFIIIGLLIFITGFIFIQSLPKKQDLTQWEDRLINDSVFITSENILTPFKKENNKIFSYVLSTFNDELMSFSNEDETFMMHFYDIEKNNMVKKESFVFDSPKIDFITFDNLYIYYYKDRINDIYRLNRLSKKEELFFENKDNTIVTIFPEQNGNVVFYGQVKVNDSIILGFFERDLKGNVSLLYNRKEMKSFSKEYFVSNDGKFVKQDDEHIIYYFYRISEIYLINIKTKNVKKLITNENKLESKTMQAGKRIVSLDKSAVNMGALYNDEHNTISVLTATTNNYSGVTLDIYSLNDNRYLKSDFIVSNLIDNSSILYMFRKNKKNNLISNGGTIVCYE